MISITVILERVAADFKQLFPIPKGFSFDQASGLYVTWPTSYEAIVSRGETKPGKNWPQTTLDAACTYILCVTYSGDWVLVHAGTSKPFLHILQFQWCIVGADSRPLS